MRVIRIDAEQAKKGRLPSLNRSSSFACLKFLGQIKSGCQTGIPVDAKIEDQRAQHEEIRLPANPLVELAEF